MVVPLALGAAGVAIGLVAKVVAGAAALAAQAGSAALATGKQAASSVMSGGKDVANAAGEAAKSAVDDPAATAESMGKNVATNAASNALTSNRSKETSPEPGGNKGMTLHEERIKKCGVECTRYIKKAENRCKEVEKAGKTGANEELSQTSSYSGPQHP
jgi:hypothetical protein